jgi:UDP-N-acetylmuramate dehydrogenase
MVSEKHANFIVNANGATASDVRALMTLVQHEVAKEFGVKLVPEVELVGEW